jgi:lysophospholipase L1-like esterase
VQPNPGARRKAPARQLARHTARAVLAALAVLGCAAGVSGRSDGSTGPIVRAAAVVAEPVPDQPRLMALGDSITFGVGSTTGTGFRADLAARLSGVGAIVEFVGSQRSRVDPGMDHEGHPGWRIDQIDDHVDEWMAISRPDVVLLDIGTNDYTQRWATSTAPTRLSLLVDRLLAASPTVRVVVARLLVTTGDARARGITAFNASIAAMAASKGSRVSVADMSRISNRNTTDGVHPNDVGYRQMAYQWFQALRGLLTGGTGWADTDNPFPVPTVRLSRSAARVAKGTSATLTAQLAGALTATDLAGVPVQLAYSRLGSGTWTVLQTLRSSASGQAVFRSSVTSTGTFVARVADGSATGRRSPAVQITVRS